MTEVEEQNKAYLQTLFRSLTVLELALQALNNIHMQSLVTPTPLSEVLSRQISTARNSAELYLYNLVQIKPGIQEILESKQLETLSACKTPLEVQLHFMKAVSNADQTRSRIVACATNY
jgi:hypothetical protein